MEEAALRGKGNRQVRGKKKETLSQVTFKNTASAHMLVVPDSVFTKTVRSPHSFCSHHSPSGLMSPNMTVSAAGSYQFLLCPG